MHNSYIYLVTISIGATRISRCPRYYENKRQTGRLVAVKRVYYKLESSAAIKRSRIWISARKFRSKLRRKKLERERSGRDVQKNRSYENFVIRLIRDLCHGEGLLYFLSRDRRGVAYEVEHKQILHNWNRVEMLTRRFSPFLPENLVGLIWLPSLCAQKNFVCFSGKSNQARRTIVPSVFRRNLKAPMQKAISFFLQNSYVGLYARVNEC